MCNVLEKNYVIDVWQGPEYTFEFARMIFACQYIPRMSKIPKFLPFLPHCSLYLLVGSSIMLPVFSFSISLPWSLHLDFPSPLPFWLLFSISLTHSYHLFSCLASCLLKLSSYLGCFFSCSYPYLPCAFLTICFVTYIMPYLIPPSVLLLAVSFALPLLPWFTSALPHVSLHFSLHIAWYLPFLCNDNN